MTPKQLAANRRNAMKSTGPQTPAGRAVSKLNALKHGILSKEVLVRGPHYRESPRELAALHQRFRDDLRPVGPVEEMLVDQIVTAHWRRRRALTAEAGEIALSVGGSHGKRNEAMDLQRQWLQWELNGDVIAGLEGSAAGLRLMEGWLKVLRQAVEREGALTKKALAATFGPRPNRLSRELEGLRQKLALNPEGLEPAALQSRNREQALRWLDDRLSVLARQGARCVEREEQEAAARQVAAVLPARETLEKITRYETRLERQLFRALAQLERIQRLRPGEAVPAPLTVDVSDPEWAER